jgi:hypothetical protein
MQENKVTFSSFNTNKIFASLAKKIYSKNKYRTNFSLLARVKSREERRRWLLPGPLAN